METLKKALASFCPALDSTEQLRRFYDTIAPDFDDGGFRLYDAALAISGYPNLPGEFPYEDNRGVFDEADGHQLLKYLTALHFHAVRWEVVPGTPYEKAVLLDVDTATPEYRAFEKQLYTQALRDLPTAPPSLGMRRCPAIWYSTRRIPMWASWAAGMRAAICSSSTAPADTTMW